MKHNGSGSARAFAVVLLGAAGVVASVSQNLPVPAPPRSQEAPSSVANCTADLEALAQTRGISQETIVENLRGLPIDTDVLASAQDQAEFVQPIWEYLDRAVTEARITTGRAKLAEWSAVLDAIESKFGVDRHILVAIWGIESTYGAVLDDFTIVRPVVRSLATLACGDQGRASFWRDELIAALQIIERGEASPSLMTGSWAGAMGHTQFMPTTYQRHAVDFDGDRRRDIWRSVPDALASTANYLTASGWRSGEGWGYEVELPPGFDYALADETTERPLSAWLQMGVRILGQHPSPPPNLAGVLVLPTGARGPAFLLLANFRVILSYNTALAYALSVAHLSDRLRGSEPFVRSWPRDDRTLTTSERRELQRILTQRGFSVGEIDGKVGPRTRAAVRAFQASAGLVPDGYADAVLLERARTERGCIRQSPAGQPCE
jgi:membrane-bound lytic murein transglycosylase B